MGNTYVTSLLSSLGTASLTVACNECDRCGRYAANRLRDELGDVTVGVAMEAIAKRAGCVKALNPPAASDVANFNDRKCRITFGPALRF